MKNKIAMELVWNNCESNPPRENWNNNLYATNGKYLHRVEYDKKHGWWSKDMGDYLPYDETKDYYWADIEQTIQNDSDFRL